MFLNNIKKISLYKHSIWRKILEFFFNNQIIKTYLKNITQLVVVINTIVKLQEKNIVAIKLFNSCEKKKLGQELVHKDL